MAKAAVAERRITFLVEPLPELLGAFDAGLDAPSLQAIAARGNAVQGQHDEPDAFRCALFEPDAGDGHVPAAALHLLANGSGVSPGTYYLRADPVTLSVDRVSVIMTGSGFADLNDAERESISEVIESVFTAESIGAFNRVPGGWVLSLERELPFEFPTLNSALGADCADLLPDHPETLAWKRLINEVQIALHGAAVNRQRRSEGRREINSLWFWGGGRAPALRGPGHRARMGTVFSDNPLTRGLAILHGSALHQLDAKGTFDFANLPREAFDVLVDWEGPGTSAKADLLALEQALARMPDAVRRASIELHLVDGSGTGWSFDRRCARRFWRRIPPFGPGSFAPGTTRNSKQ